jgi:hypothetical protein
VALETATNEKPPFCILTNERGFRVAHQTATIHIIHMGCRVASLTKVYGDITFAYQRGRKVALETATNEKPLFCKLTSERGFRVAHQTATIHFIHMGCRVASMTKIYGDITFAYQSGSKVALETATNEKALFSILINERGCRVAYQTATIHIIQVV